MDHIIIFNMSEKKNMLWGLKCEEAGKLRNLCAYVMPTHVRVRLNTMTMDSPIQLKHLEANITCLLWES
jgi:hypothetical protein